MSNTVRTGKNVLVVVFSSVAPRYQGRGVGFRLIAALVNWAQRAGFCELYLDTGADEREPGASTDGTVSSPSSSMSIIAII
jgi:GNAT superfamily N-acetyltransferase